VAPGAVQARATSSTGYEHHTTASLAASLKSAKKAMTTAQGRIDRINREMKRRQRAADKQGRTT